MSRQNHSKNVRYIMGELYLYNEFQGDWIKIFSQEIGDIKYSVRSDNHNGWLKCDGSVISRTEYSELFAVIGTSFGNGDGVNTFNLPDTRGRVLGGINTTYTIGNMIGSPTHTLTVNQMPTHSHTITDLGHSHNINDPGHSHNVGNTNFYNSMQTPDGLDNNEGVIGSEQNLIQSQTTTSTTSTTGITINTNTTGIIINTSGNSQAFNIMQPTTFIGNVFVLAKQHLITF
jgi:microcystin-dependent protein